MKTIERAWRGGKSEWKLHALSALSISVAFMCLTFALLAVTNLRGLEHRWQAAGRISAFLQSGVSEADALSVTRVLRSTPDVETARYVSAERARLDLLSGGDNTLLEALPSAAFPASIEVKLVSGANAGRSAEVASQLIKLPSVESVETYQAWTQRLSKFAQAATLLASTLALIVFVAVSTLVSSSIKLMLERRRSEVEVLRVVGATSAYVRRPFMVEGAAQGALGAAVAIGITAAMFGFATQRFDQQLSLVFGMAPQFLPWFVGAALVACGAILGGFSSLWSLRRSFSV